MINLDCAAKSNLYPGVKEEASDAFSLHNPYSESFAGKEAKLKLFSSLDEIASRWGVESKNLFFADSCTSVLQKLHFQFGINWNCYSIEHNSAVSLATNVVDYNCLPWDDSLGDSEDRFWLQSRFNHELGFQIERVFSEKKIIDATTMDPKKTEADFIVFSAAKYGSLPLGVCIARNPEVLEGWGKPTNLPAIAALAQSYRWVFSSEGQDRMAGLSLIKSKILELDSVGWVPVTSDSKKIQAFFTDHEAELLISEGEREGLVLASGSACNSGATLPNRTAGLLYGEEKANNVLRLSWDLTWTESDASLAVERLRKLVEFVR